jgi:putative transposase
MDSLRFFNPYEEIRFTENLLPHWQQKGGTYFITFRFADSIPAHLREQWEDEREIWLRFHPEPWTPETEQEYHKRFSAAIERWLDGGYGSCILRQSECATIVDDTLRHSMGSASRSFRQSSCPIMFMRFCFKTRSISWRICCELGRHSVPERSINYRDSGTLWQRSYFNRLVRDEKHFRNCVRYIRRNPEKAHLIASEYILYESDLAKQIE